jgi:hypothetical protein
MKKYFFYGFVFALVIGVCQGFTQGCDCPIESNSIADVLEYANKDTTIVFDIDCTLIIPNLKNALPGISGTDKAKKELKYLWDKNWQEEITVKTSEPDIADLIQRIQDSGIKILAHTSRPPRLKTVVKEQLRSVQIEMNNNSICDGEVIVRSYDDKHGFAFGDGILMTDKNDKVDGNVEKGEILLKFFDRISYSPSNVVFIDDDKRNVESVMKALQAQQIPVIGLWYTRNKDSYPIFKEEDFQ